MLLRNSTSGAFQVYNVAPNNNIITNSASLGAVGLNFKVLGFGNFGSFGNTDMLLRDDNTGGLQVYNIANNQLTGSFSLGAVGTDWKFAGVAPVSAPGASDLVLRNFNTGAFQVYNIAGNTLVGSASLGAPGPDWQLGGFAASTPAGSMGSSGAPLDSASQPAAMDGSTAQTGTSTFQLADANGNAVGSPVDPSSFSSSMVNPAPPDATTANMVLRNASTTTATYEIYNHGANSIL